MYFAMLMVGQRPHPEFIGQISKTPKKKLAKARIGSKAAKQAERMEVGGETLDNEAATMYRALSA